MRISLNEIKVIDDYLLGRMAPDDALVFEASRILNEDLESKVRLQQSAYTLIRQYSRQKLKEEIAAVQQTLATAPQHRGFREQILRLFKKY